MLSMVFLAISLVMLRQLVKGLVSQSPFLLRGALDQWEMRVGDSIVEKINSALTTASHLVLLLSAHSVTKPWVKREFSSAFMRQLADSSITVLPVRLDDCEIPAILSDIRYADCRSGKVNGFNETKNTLFPERLT